MDVLTAPAKLTLTLRITGVRDDGFHLIDAEMVTVDLADTLTLTEGSGLDIVDPDGDPVELAGDGDNLVERALDLVRHQRRVRLDKRIPAGAGLGGGSADAAAILRWAGYDDLVGASTIGADVAFCLVGGRARVSGIGEIVEPLAFEPRTFTLCTPPFGCSTPAVYAAWDRLGGPTGPHGNDLEPAALDAEPRLAAIRDELAQATGQVPRLAGSGSTWFVEGEFAEAGVVVHTIPARPGPSHPGSPDETRERRSARPRRHRT